MKIGIPREVKSLEGRVALLPEACAELVRLGHEVLVQRTAGQGCHIDDSEFERAGAHMLADADALYGAAELVVKVKEPWGDEIDRLRPRTRLFSYLHLAAEPELTRRLCEIGLTAVGFETVVEHGRLPLLAPMSEIAGRLAVQIGATLLHGPQGGRGLLLGGMSTAERGHVLVLGAGNAGAAAVQMAAGMGAWVRVFDNNAARLAAMRAVGDNVTTLHPFRDSIEEALLEADLVIGAVLLPGARTPHLVSAEQVGRMRSGSAIVDVSVDQGGCIETIRPTTYENPTYVVDRVVHFGVTNMPGAVPLTASRALSAAILPWVERLAEPDWRDHEALRGAINVDAGRVVHPALLDQ